MRERVPMMKKEKKYWDLPMQANVPSLCVRGGEQFVAPSYCFASRGGCVGSPLHSSNIHEKRGSETPFVPPI